MFKLDKDLCFFDIESTGLNILTDRIVQIAIIKYPVKGKPQEYNLLVNPEMPIPSESSAIHGITDEMVAGEKTFTELAPWLYLLLKDADLAGYNSNRFDIPMLMEEFHRAGIEFGIEGRRTIDVQAIFYKMEPRTLKAAFKFYTGNILENAHDALADVRATADVLKGQIAMYEGKTVDNEHGESLLSPVKNDMQALHEFTSDPRRVDSSNRFRLDDKGNIVFNFGKHQGEIAIKHEPYLHWIINNEFSAEVKQVCRNLLNQIKANKS
jgi:DNA polymerase-3 subunit epsilon